MTKKSIIESLQKQLKSKGVNYGHFLDLITDYAAMWDTKNKLIADIRRRGVIVTTHLGHRPNPSIKEVAGLNKQMLALLREIGLTEDASMYGGGDDEDDRL